MTINDFLANYGFYIALVVFSVIVIIAVVFISVPRLTKEPQKEVIFDKNAFISFLGGRENIDSITGNGSRLTVVLVDQTKMNVEEIKKHGVTRAIIMQSKVVLLMDKQIVALFDEFL